MAEESKTLKGVKIHTTVSIPIEQYQWVKDNPQFSFSGLLSWAIKQHKEMSIDFSDLEG